MRCLVEHQLAGHEVGVGHPRRRDDQPGGVHLRPFVEHHSGLVDQDNLPVGVDVPGDLRRVRPGHPVQRYRGRRRLHKIDCLLRADIKTLPVDCCPLGALGDRRRVRSVADCRTAGGYDTPGRMRVHRRLRTSRRRREEYGAGLQRGAEQQRGPSAPHCAKCPKRLLPVRMLRLWLLPTRKLPNPVPSIQLLRVRPPPVPGAPMCLGHPLILRFGRGRARRRSVPHEHPPVERTAIQR